MPRQIVPAFAIVLVALAAGIALAPGRFSPAAAGQASPAAAGTPCPTTTAEENAALFRRYYEEAWGQGHLEVLEEVVAEGYVLHIPGLAIFVPAAPPPHEGRALLAESIQEFRTNFPDLRVTVEEMVAEGDTVAVQMTFAGSQADPLEAWDSPNTRRPMARDTWSFARVACGRIAEEWVLPDNLTLLRQLGIITDEELADAGTPTVVTPAP